MSKNKDNKLNANALEAVAGGAQKEMIIQEIIHKEGFDNKWLKGATEKNQAFDSDFLEFLDREYGAVRLANIVGRYKDQADMFK